MILAKSVSKKEKDKEGAFEAPFLLAVKSIYLDK